jgi:hypothetical protein
MDKPSRRELVRDYKDRKVARGIYAVRCATTGEAWVGQSRNLVQQQNGVWFSLRQGGHPNRALQAAWAAHGEAAFAYEILEALDDDDLSAMVRDDLLKARAAHWRDALRATKIVG